MFLPLKALRADEQNQLFGICIHNLWTYWFVFDVAPLLFNLHYKLQIMKSSLFEKNSLNYFCSVYLVNKQFEQERYRGIGKSYLKQLWWRLFDLHI